MEMTELLPIGSVVLLHNGKKKVMIIGVMQRDRNKRYDYLGVLYPEGSLGPTSQVLFDHENVKEVFFRGFEDEERDKFVDFLTDYYKDK